MKCQVFRDRLDEYLDREQNLKQKQIMDEHKADCSDCRSLFEQRQTLFRVMDKSTESTQSYDIADSVMNRIRELPVLTPPHPLRKPFIIAVIAALFLSGILVLIGYQSMPDTVSPVDLLHLASASVNLPEDVRASLNELLSFLNIGWIIFRTLTHVVIQVAVYLLVRIPLMVPFVFVMLSGILFIVWRYRRLRKGSVTAGLLL